MPPHPDRSPPNRSSTPISRLLLIIRDTNPKLIPKLLPKLILKPPSPPPRPRSQPPSPPHPRHPPTTLGLLSALLLLSLPIHALAQVSYPDSPEREPPPPPPSPVVGSPACLPTQTLSPTTVQKPLSPNPYAPYDAPNYGQPAPALPTPPAYVVPHKYQQVLQKRWSGYATLTVFVNTVTINAGAPQVVTVTANQENQQPAPGTVTVTVGAYTEIIGQPGVLVPGASQQPVSTQTVFAGGAGPMTIKSTSTITIGAAPTGVPHIVGGKDDSSGLPADRPCYPGEENQRYPGKLLPTHPTQTSTLFAIGVYFVFILVSWNLFVIRQLIYPIKLLVVCWHEFGHVVACALSGARLESVTIDPNEGGATRMHALVYPPAGLPLGYISSCLFGGVMVFCGFDTLASKVASFIIGMSLMVVFWWADGMTTRILTLGAMGLMIGFWFIDHAGVLRYYVLFVGVMSSWYVLYDVMDDFVFRKLNACCPVLFEERFPSIRAGMWAMIWTIYSGISFGAWILLGLYVWRQTPRAMFCQSQEFLPT